VEIAYLRDHLVLAPALAQAHVDAFGALLPDWTVEQALDELKTHDRRRAIPTTLIAVEEDDWLGSVSLLQNDHDDIRQYSPWLASLYVKPEARCRGAGRALVTRCVQEAAALGIERLYLYCTDAVDYYRGLGWRVQDQLQLGPLFVTVMAIDPLPYRPQAENQDIPRD
jgi:N-acetylglutamate synthase-like GNAT family acetyltransferase